MPPSPTALERDTLLVPEWTAESVAQEVERFLKTNLPENFAERLAAKAHHLYRFPAVIGGMEVSAAVATPFPRRTGREFAETDFAP